MELFRIGGIHDPFFTIDQEFVGEAVYVYL